MVLVQHDLQVFFTLRDGDPALALAAPPLLLLSMMSAARTFRAVALLPARRARFNNSI